MAYNFNLLEKKLAEQKVYDAWQYVQSLQETLKYMTISYEMLVKVYEYRKETIYEIEKNTINTAIETGQASVGEEELSRTNLNVGGYVLNDSTFLRKTALEFFHYARISTDVLFQIINAALLGDESYPITERSLLGKVTEKLNTKPEFSILAQLLKSNKEDELFKYIVAFDNHVKHIKTVLIVIRNSFMIEGDDEFIINEFYNDGKTYKSEDALEKIKEINKYLTKTIENILNELLQQIPNCMNNSQRVHDIRYKIQKGRKEALSYIAFFIEVENGLNELPKEIKVLPLLIKSNDEVQAREFKHDKIFISKKNSLENGIIGCAELKSKTETNELYNTFEVKPCSKNDYLKYIGNFTENYENSSFDFQAMEGQIVMVP